jgi:hypothetical protein
LRNCTKAYVIQLCDKPTHPPTHTQTCIYIHTHTHTETDIYIYTHTHTVRQ